ncbi:MAG: hypothetical protein HYX86_03985 [Chloroflexi bacterium]|nr:hypothetical protein [Chloroflexota bacterium]
MPKIRALLFLGLLVLLTSCRPSAPTTMLMPSPTQPFPSPSPTRSLPSPKLPPLPQGISIQPILTAPQIFGHSFSPDNKFLAYWTFSAEELATYFHPVSPPGTLHFLNVSTGETCESPQEIEYGFGHNIAWLPDGRVMLFADGRVLVGKACGQDFMDISGQFPAPVGLASVSPDGSLFLLSSMEGFLFYEPQTGAVRRVDADIAGGGSTWSPDGSRVAISAELTDPSVGCVNGICNAGTWAINVQTGKVETFIPWQFEEGEGGLAGPLWLGEKRFLIWTTHDRGPLMVILGVGVREVLKQYFPGYPELKCAQRTCQNLIATGARVGDTSNYHLLLSAGTNGEATQHFLYHAEGSGTDVLPFPEFYGFSPDGRWLFVAYPWPERGTSLVNLILWTRPVDPLGSNYTLLTTRSSGDLIRVSPDSTTVAVGSDWPIPNFQSVGMLFLFSLSDGAQIGLWNLGEEWSPFYALWSRDGKFLAVGANPPSWAGGSRQEAALFIIELS